MTRYALPRFVAGVLLLAPLWFNSTSAQGARASPGAGERVVLPDLVMPNQYRIDITPDADALTFSGSVQIDLTIRSPTDRIVLNSANLVIDSAVLSGDITPPAIVLDNSAETATFRLGHVVAPGPYTLSLVYRGKINRQASGLFALDYDTPHGKARALYTQFENADARRFVPCWDEPARKATFQLTVTVPGSLMPVSNTPIGSTEVLSDNSIRVHFATTPRMSPYLLFFALGDFERIHKMVDGVDVGVIVKWGDTTNARYALDAAAHLLPFYNSYFGTPYPLPKLDLIAGPGSSQFFSAMENWGAIFYFESVLLVDPRVSTESDRQRVYSVVAHEMSHQWFGNLVTMAWWDDLWLNEGFASWMQNKATAHFHPEWNMWLQSLAGKQTTMMEDAREGTHPVIAPIDDVLQANEAFDGITYTKGAAVIRTLESYAGEDAFRAGVRRYLHDHAYGNAVSDDLWKAMDQGAARPITQIAHDLTLQSGVPMVIEESAACQNGQTDLLLSQDHFSIDADSTKAHLWHIPVSAASLGGAAASTLVGGSTPQPLQIAGCGAAILNAGQTGYLRSHYSLDGLNTVLRQYQALSPDDQVGVLNDTSSLAFVGQYPMAALLNLTAAFPPDANPVVANTLISLLHDLDRIYDGLPQQTAFRTYARGILNPIFAHIGWDKSSDESDNVALLRLNLITQLGDLGDPAILVQSTKRFERYLADPTALDAATRRPVLHNIAVHADQRMWEQLHNMAIGARSELERRELYGLLGEPEDAMLVQQALDLSISNEPPPTIAPNMITQASIRHPQMTLDFAIAHWTAIAPLIEFNSRVRFMPKLLSVGSDLGLVDKLNTFARAHIPAAARQDVRKANAHVRYFTMIRQQRLPAVDQWVNEHSK